MQANLINNYTKIVRVQHKIKIKNDKIGNSPDELNVPRQAKVAEEITTRTHTNRSIKAHAAFCHSKTEAVCSSLAWPLAFLSFLRTPVFPKLSCSRTRFGS
jgi:hypothetical protein